MKKKKYITKKDAVVGTAYGGLGGYAGRKIGAIKSKQFVPITKARILVHHLLRHPKSRKAALEAGLKLEQAIKTHRFFRPYRMSKHKGMLIGALLGAGYGVGISKLDTHLKSKRKK